MVTGGNILARNYALWEMELGEFWATVHAVLLYDREETTVFTNTEHSDWKAADDAVSAFINSGAK